MGATSKWNHAATKYCLFFFNFVFVLCGFLLIGFSLVALYYHAVVGHAYTASLGLVLGVAAVTFLVAFVGCFTAIHPSRCMLSLFGSFLLGIVLAEVIGLVCVAVNGGANELMDSALEREFKKATVDKDLGARISVDAIQNTHYCCGFAGAAEWGSEVPLSCCSRNRPDSCYPRKSCLVGVTEYREKITQFVGGAGTAFFISQIIGACLAFYLAKLSSSEREKDLMSVYTLLK